MKKYICWRNTRCKSTSPLPHFLLKWKGVVDGKKGVGIVDSSIEKLYKKEASIEAEECVICENFLSNSRKDAAKLLRAIYDSETKLKNVSISHTGTDFDSIRTNRRNSNIRSTSETTVSLATERLCEISQEIITVETILEERIKHLRDKCSAQIEAYISGVRAIINDYTFKTSYDNTALEIYNQKHHTLDEAIRIKVEAITNKEVSQDEDY